MSSITGQDDKVPAALSVLLTGQEDSKTGQRMDTAQKLVHNKVTSKKEL